MMFVTAFICVLDLETNRVTFINAGHNLPFVQKADGEFQMITAKANMVLGMMEDVPYREQYSGAFKGGLYISVYGWCDRGVKPETGAAWRRKSDKRVNELTEKWPVMQMHLSMPCMTK